MPEISTGNCQDMDKRVKSILVHGIFYQEIGGTYRIHGSVCETGSEISVKEEYYIFYGEGGKEIKLNAQEVLDKLQM